MGFWTRSFLRGILGGGVWKLLLRRLFNQYVAFATLILLVNSSFFIKISTMVACESLLTLMSIWALYFIWKSFDCAPWAMAGGICTGLAYLTKANGMFLLLFYGLIIILKYRHRFLRQKSLWLYILGFCLIASPLLVRNVVLFGNPMHNYNSRLLWIETYDTRFTDAFVENEGEGFTFLRYLKTQALSGVVERFQEGIVLQWQTLYEATEINILWRLRNVFFLLVISHEHDPGILTRMTHLSG